MPPKKKKSARSKSKSDKSKQDALLDIPLSEAAKNKIEALELDKGAAEVQRNYAQLEKDKMCDFWEITNQQLKDAENSCKNKDREMEMLEEQKHMEIQIYRQKVKHLMFENQGHVMHMNMDNEFERILMEKDFRAREDHLLEYVDQLKEKNREQELSHEHYVATLSTQHEKELEKLRKEYQLEMTTAQKNFEEKFKTMRQAMEMQRKRDNHEITERKNKHVKEMMAKHETDYENIRHYYNDIVSNNLDLIKSLKENIMSMKQTELRNEKLMLEIVAKNKQMAEPFAKAVQEVEDLRSLLTQYEKDKIALTRTRARLVAAEKNFKNLEFDYEVLEQRYAKLHKDRDDVYEHFENTVYNVQQRAGIRDLMSFKKVERLSQDIEKKKCQLAECIVAANLDPHARSVVNDKLEEILEDKNKTISQLKMDIAKISKAHNDLIVVYEAKLLDCGIHPGNLGLRPLLTNTSRNPAGLVSGL